MPNKVQRHGKTQWCPIDTGPLCGALGDGAETRGGGGDEGRGACGTIAWNGVIGIGLGITGDGAIWIPPPTGAMPVPT